MCEGQKVLSLSNKVNLSLSHLPLLDPLFRLETYRIIKSNSRCLVRSRKPRAKLCALLIHCFPGSQGEEGRDCVPEGTYASLPCCLLGCSPDPLAAPFSQFGSCIKSHLLKETSFDSLPGMDHTSPTTPHNSPPQYRVSLSSQHLITICNYLCIYCLATPTGKS